MSRMLTFSLVCLSFLLVSTGLSAAEYRLEPLEQPAPSEGLAAEIASELSPTGYKLIKGKSRTVCEFWPRKSWPVQADFKSTGTVLYPFAFGELLGVIHYPRKATDFRGQEIVAGIYTVRYAQQPVDGNHVGTSETLDFVLLVNAAEDQKLAPLEKAALFKLSAQAAMTTHPCMLCLKAAPTDQEKLPVLLQDEEGEEVSLVLAAPAGEAATPLPIKLVLVGQAAE